MNHATRPDLEEVFLELVQGRGALKHSGSEGRKPRNMAGIERVMTAYFRAGDALEPVSREDLLAPVLNNKIDDFTIKPGVPNSSGLVQGEANTVAPRTW